MSEDPKSQEERNDDLFRNTLEGIRIEPAPNVWKKVNRSLLFHEMIRFNFTNVPGRLWLIIPAAVIILGTAIYFSWPVNESSSNSLTAAVNTSTVQPVPATSVQTASTAWVPDNTQTAKKEINAGDRQAYKFQPVSQTVDTRQEPDEVLPDEPVSITKAGSNPDPSPGMTESHKESTTAGRETETIRLPGIYPYPASGKQEACFNPQLIETNPEPPTRFDFPESQVRPSMASRYEGFGAGINITPEMMFYKNSSNSFKYDYTIDLGVQYSFGRFYIQSGAGFTYSTGIGNYTIDYLKNDSVGFYYNVSSFVYDPEHPEQLIFQTKLITVYDSVEYIYDYSTRNKYYYLNIPLSIGYRIIHKPTLGLSVNLGMIYGWLIKANEPSPSFYMPESRILSIESENPVRTKSNLGLTGGVKFEYRFANNFYLVIEPTFRYYLRMVDEKSAEGMKQPYSIGLRTGIWYQFDLKKRNK